MRNKSKIVKDIIAITAALSSIPTSSLVGYDRRKEVVLARMVMSNILMKELDFHYTELQDLVGYDRTSFYYYEGKHIDNYQYWREYRELYDQIKLAYFGDNQYKNIDLKDIQDTLKYNNIGDDSYDARFKLRFKIGNNEVDVLCRDLTETLERINKIYKDYNFTFKVQHLNSVRYE